MGFFSAKSTTYDPMSAYTPQQRQAIQALMSLASTGSGGGITLGEKYGGDLGYYTQGAGELQALAGLQGLVGGQDITGARDVYARMAGNKFNPDDPSSGYAAFSRALAKAGAEAADVLNREAAMTGGRFGTGIQRQKASLAEDLANQRGQFLANLYNQGENRAMAGAQGLQSLVGTQQNLFQQLASQAAIERLLKDQQAKDQYAEFNRTRNEQLSRIGLMQEQWQNPMGAITKKGPSTFGAILGEAIPIMGSYNTHKYGYTQNQTSIGDAVKAATAILSGGMMSGGGGQKTPGVGTSSTSIPEPSWLSQNNMSGGFNSYYGY